VTFFDSASSRTEAAITSKKKRAQRIETNSLCLIAIYIHSSRHSILWPSIHHAQAASPDSLDSADLELELELEQRRQQRGRRIIISLWKEQHKHKHQHEWEEQL